jgi:hypothetical protein
LQQSDRHLLGGARDLSTAIIGRRATECELELLMLLDPQAPPEITPSPPSGERVGVRGRATGSSHPPSPDRGLAPAATLTRNAGEGLGIRDRPDGPGLLALGREMLLEELLPRLPPERHRDVRLVATAMAIAEREMLAGDAPPGEIADRLAKFYGAPASSRQEGRQDAGAPTTGLFARFAGDLRVGAFEACEARGRAACAILWRLTILKLREGNPGFLARNGFGA